jgi:Ni,Fe-hydrogenase I large subunit
MAGKDAKGAITPEESATAILKLADTFDPAETGTGVHSYDGQVVGW